MISIHLALSRIVRFLVHAFGPSFSWRQPRSGEMFMEQMPIEKRLAPSGAEYSAAHKWANEIEMETETINISCLRHSCQL
jgi:hypothetical protein